MVSSLPNARFERKLLATGLSAEQAVALVLRHPMGFRQAYPPRVVNNFYLDSPGLRSYHEHVNGAAQRVKTRVRWYGAPTCHIPKAAVERKFKSGLLSGKTTEPLPAFELNGKPTRGMLDEVFSKAKVSELLRLQTADLSPALFNRYFRRYYVSGNGRFRLTVDSDLQFGPASSESAVRELPRLPALVLELKYRPEAAAEAERVTNALPFRLTRFSKYVLGIERMGL